MNIAREKQLHPSIIKDITLAPNGYKKLEWVKQNMPVLNMLRKEFEASQPLQGKIGRAS